MEVYCQWCFFNQVDGIILIDLCDDDFCGDCIIVLDVCVVMIGLKFFLDGVVLSVWIGDDVVVEILFFYFVVFGYICIVYVVGFVEFEYICFCVEVLECMVVDGIYGEIIMIDFLFGCVLVVICILLLG